MTSAKQPNQADNLKSATVDKPRPKKRGPKKPHAGSFKPGPDARRHGHKGPGYGQIKFDLITLCRESAPEAHEKLMDMIRNEEEPTKVRLNAIQLVLAYAAGKPVERAIIGIDAPEAGGDLTKLSDAQLEAMIVKMAAPAEGVLIEHE